MKTFNRRLTFALWLIAASATASAAPAMAGRYSPEGPYVTVVTPSARLNLRLARLVGESQALRCVRALPRHGGMLLSVYDQQHPGVFGPHYYYAHADEVAIDASGRVIAGVLDVPLLKDDAPQSYRHGFLAKARYIIDVPAGEAIQDGLVPGQRVRIIAGAKALEAERDHSVPAPRPCPA